MVSLGMVTWAALPISSAQASMNGSSLTQGAGVAAPSKTSAIEENPAGLIENGRSTVTGAVRSDSTSFNPLSYEGLFTAGNGSVGVGLGYFHHAGGGKNDLLYGLAAESRSLGLTIGVNGTLALSSGNAFDLNLGAQFRPQSRVIVGATAYSLKGGVDGYGAGVAYEWSTGALLGVDATSNGSFKGISLKPSLKVTEQNLSLMAGYGFKMTTDAPMTKISDQASLGLSYNFGNTDFQFYYQQLDKVYVALSFAI